MGSDGRRFGLGRIVLLRRIGSVRWITIFDRIIRCGYMVRFGRLLSRF